MNEMIATLLALSLADAPTELSVEPGQVMDGVEAPDYVLAVVRDEVEGRYLAANAYAAGHDSAEQTWAFYDDWRIEALAHAYTYDDFEGRALDVYRLNYELHTTTPDLLLLAGEWSDTDLRRWGGQLEPQGLTVVPPAGADYQQIGQLWAEAYARRQLAPERQDTISRLLEQPLAAE